MLTRFLAVAVAMLLAGASSVSAQSTRIPAQPPAPPAINKDTAEGNVLAVNGTPTFFVGKTTAQSFETFRIVGAQPYAVFQQGIEALLK